MRITKPKRGRRGTKRVDLTDMRELFRDRRMWTAIGIVVKPDDGEHFEEVTGPADVLVEVVLQPSLVPVSCRLAAGVWMVPSVGEEVAVLIPEGQPAFMPLIIANLSSNSLPTDQGPAEDRIAIVRDEIVAHDGTGGAVALTKQSDFEALRNHVNALLTGGSGSAAVPAPSAGTGTTVFKAK